MYVRMLVELSELCSLGPNNMLKILPIILSQNYDSLFLFYSHIITYYSYLFL